MLWYKYNEVITVIFFYLKALIKKIKAYFCGQTMRNMELIRILIFIEELYDSINK